MTVRELIRELEYLDKDMEVKRYSEGIQMHVGSVLVLKDECDDSTEIVLLDS